MNKKFENWNVNYETWGDYQLPCVTTKKEKELYDVFNKHCVIIFDECHRSQFGDMHAKIVKAFKKYHLFGFTGTPIFAANAQRGKHLAMLTTPQTFGDQLHTSIIYMKTVSIIIKHCRNSAVKKNLTIGTKTIIIIVTF